MNTLIWLWTFHTSLRRDGEAIYASANASSAVRSWMKRVESWSEDASKLTPSLEELSARVAK